MYHEDEQMKKWNKNLHVHFFDGFSPWRSTGPTHTLESGNSEKMREWMDDALGDNYLFHDVAYQGRSEIRALKTVYWSLTEMRM